ncbi:hypothetical protein CXF68_20305 [Tenacibaculum sp. Bg11-29]|uniref:hypothetical protein n=1 Tax=Tenacibaculum sp. Bg11-29 TaxID=2058306 RepID=UPI000C31E7B0|nr:hypothetical protein [Tenacibaculum sp. Bg11-29]PKH52897.1 hypothetical protein CXF68_20305 [Tenacibaculum sp. Bg11-29]
MKRRKKNKQILIKRIYFDSDTFDYIYKDEKEALQVINNTKDRTDNFKVEKAEWYISIEYKTIFFFNSKHFEKIIYMIIGSIITLTIGYLFRKWF